MKNPNKVIFITVLLIICVYLTACSVMLSVIPLAAASEQEAAAAGNPGTGSTSENSQSKTENIQIQREKVVESWEEFNASNLPLISAIPDRDIYLYGIKPSGVVLYVKGGGHYFNWNYMTPRFMLPKMNIGDFDADNEEELSIVLYVGSGTGYAVEELHIVEISSDEVLSRDPASKDYFVPNPEYFGDHFYRPEDYLSQLNEVIKLKPYYKKGQLMADIRINGEASTVSLKQLQSIDKNITVNDTAAFGNIVFFNYNDGKLTAQFALGVTSNSYAAPYPVGEVHAEVEYSKGGFKLLNMSFKPGDEFLLQ